MFLLHDYFNGKLPTTFNDFYAIQQNPDKEPPLDLRVIRPPSRYNEYDVTDADTRPHLQNEYIFRNHRRSTICTIL